MIRRAFVFFLAVGGMIALYIGEQLSQLQINFLFFVFLISMIIGVSALVWFVIKVITNENRNHRLVNEQFSQHLLTRDQPPVSSNPYYQAPITLVIFAPVITPHISSPHQLGGVEDNSSNYPPPQVVRSSFPPPRPSKPLALPDNRRQVTDDQDVS